MRSPQDPEKESLDYWIGIDDEEDDDQELG
jgi:hypothetical protein